MGKLGEGGEGEIVPESRVGVVAPEGTTELLCKLGEGRGHGEGRECSSGVDGEDDGEGFLEEEGD